MPQYSFGSGVLFGRDTQAAVPTPVKVGVLQGCSVDFAFTTKQLYGQYQFPVAIGRGTAKVTGKADFAQFNALAFNTIFFGQSSVSDGQRLTAVEEVANVAACAVTVTHNGTYLRDLGVILSSNQAILQRVSASPTGTGNYACNETTGVYTFCSALNGSNVKISYNYNDAANGATITLTNQALGLAPTFLACLTETFRSKSMNLILNACTPGKMTLATRLEDFTIPNFDFEANADDSNVLGTLSVAEL